MEFKMLERSFRVAIAIFLALLVLATAANAWTYSYATGIPLVQADAWSFLDTYLRKHLQGDFRFIDFFLQGRSSDTNLPLHKLILLFHTDHFHMDFKVEGLIGVAAGIALVCVLTFSTVGMSPSRWTLSGLGLLAFLTLVTLSLNSTNVYTWPLVTMWFLNLLIAVVYLVYMAKPVVGPLGALLATILLGLLLDEVAMITVLAAVAALLIQRDARPWRTRLPTAGAALVALLLVRAGYWWFDAIHAVLPELNSTPGLLKNLASLVSTDGLQLFLIPLGDSLVHQSVLAKWYPARETVVGNAIGAVLTLAHAWFWWEVFRSRDVPIAESIKVRRISIALMLFFYGTVAGIALQRVPAFGVEYLHQPRYVIFYQMNLAALGLMAYAVFTGRPAANRSRPFVGALLMVGLLGLGLLQWNLSLRAWDHAKYLSVYVEGAAVTMGRLAIEPGSDMQCADILTVCDLATDRRRDLMSLLWKYKLNIFSPDFQALHRLRPFPSAPVPTSGPLSVPAAGDSPGG